MTKIILDNLNNAMRNKRYNQRTLAQKIGLTTSTINSRMQKTTSWKLTEILDICDLLNIPDEKIRTYDNKTRRKHDVPFKIFNVGRVTTMKNCFTCAEHNLSCFGNPAGLCTAHVAITEKPDPDRAIRNSEFKRRATDLELIKLQLDRIENLLLSAPISKQESVYNGESLQTVTSRYNRHTEIEDMDDIDIDNIPYLTRSHEDIDTDHTMQSF
jgi:DNA-binding Xre family transcriptional regulator